MLTNLIAMSTLKCKPARVVMFVGVFALLLVLQVFFNFDGCYNLYGNVAIRLIVDAVLAWSLTFCTKQFWK